MKNFLVFAILLFLYSFLNAQTPAFPGAEGYGRYVTGGRGGRVIYVTHTRDALNKYDYYYKGSLRAALETPGNDPITIVFACGGVIQLVSPIICSRSNITIACQTAPGDGVCIMGYGLSFSGQNLIIRYLRVRVGDRINQNTPCLTFSNGKKAIIDHCSFSWSVEENVNITDVDSVTMQWCIISESLYSSTHIKGARAYGAQLGGEHSSYHHNLWAHHNSRMPRNNGNTSNDYQLTWDYRNNVHYNWGNPEAFYGGGIEQPGGYVHSNVINNYFKPGPATTTDKNQQYFCAPSGGRTSVVGPGNEYIYGYGLWYLSGNVMHDNPAKTQDNWLGLFGPIEHRHYNEFEAAPVTTTSAYEAYEQVLANAGATKPKRDFIDERIVNEVINGTATLGGVFGANKGIIDSHTAYMNPPSTDKNIIQIWEKTLYMDVKNTSPLVPVDTDKDGIPDWWEIKNGLNPNDSLDGRQYAADGSGYTNLEIYLNSDDVGKTSSVKKIINNTDQPDFNIYPNPVIADFKIFSVLKPELVELYDISGIKIFSDKLNSENNYNISNIKPGNYYLRVIFSNGKSAVKKIIKF